MSSKNTKNSINKDTFGKRLRKLRKTNKLSQVELASRIGYKRGGSVSNIEADKTPPDIQSLVKIAEILKADLHWLITGGSSPEAKKWESNYYQALEKITRFLAKQLTYLLGEKEQYQSQLLEEEKKTNQDEDVKDMLRFQINRIESDLQELSEQQPWLKQAIMSVEIFKKIEQIPPKTLRKITTKTLKNHKTH